LRSILISSSGLIPEPQQDLTTIFARFADAGGFSPAEVVALIASHSIARSDHIEPNLKAVPFDSTPFVVSEAFSISLDI
jgi:hypothetical protein